MSDPINPNHYKIGGIETFDVIKAKSTQEEVIGYCKGNNRKYLDRRGHKQSSDLTEVDKLKNRIEECRKQRWYLDKEEEIYVEELAKLTSPRNMPDEWIEDPLHDED
jgi:hypothetical protein